MPADQHDVTRHDVEHLWDDAISGRLPAASIADRAEALLGRVSSENPVVNWGLTDVYHLHRFPSDSSVDLIGLRDRWRRQLAEHDVDSDGWMRQYFRSMIAGFAVDHGVERGRAFGLKLVRGGRLTPDDVTAALSSVAEQTPLDDDPP